MQKWVVSEKGKPSDRWELSIIDSQHPEFEQLKTSSGWGGEGKIIVWSSCGSCELTACDLLADKLRIVAVQMADELNVEAQSKATATSEANVPPPAFSAKALFDFVLAFSSEPANIKNGEQYPNFKTVAKHFGVTYDQIEIACEDWNGDEGYMGYAVGARAGGGHYEFNTRGEYLVEAYTE